MQQSAGPRSPRDPNESPNVAAFYKGKIIYVDWEDVPTAFTITSQSMYELQKNFFLEKWEIAK